ncbi:hypothetical protein BGX28_002494 [Mortierella sp. GBA30]|nr:hypothetical protein BGX28_002494 [Mortierella sp. GBA30]
MATAIPQPRPPITTPDPFPIQTLPPVTRTSAPPQRTTTNVPSRVHSPRPQSSSAPGNDGKVESSDGMSGGAIAGLVVGALVILVCSVVGGFLLLKKRRRRLMATGKRYDGYPDTSSRTQKQGRDDDDYGSEAEKGGLSGMWSGFRTRAQKAMDGVAKPTSIPSTPTEAASGGGIALQQHQQQYEQARAISPTFVSGSERAISPTPTQTHMSGVLPPTGPLQLPQEPYVLQQQPVLQALHAGPAYVQSNSTAVPYIAGQPVPQLQQQQRAMTPTPVQTITTPASQPYYYQPGTGLVSVPNMLPPPLQQVPSSVQHQQMQHIPHPPIPVQYSAQPYQPTPPTLGVHNMVYPAPPRPMSTTAALHPPIQAPPSLQHQLSLRQSQMPVSFPPPPPVVEGLSSNRTSSVAGPATATPESGSIFLPGDSSRPLLGQGLFKIVPDAEDEEETKRLMKTAASGGTADSAPPLDLNLGGDFLSSVIKYQNQDQRFEALDASHRLSSSSDAAMRNSFLSQGSSVPSVVHQRPETAASVVAAAKAASNNKATAAEGEFQEYRREAGYHDRLAGQKDRPKNQPRYLIDKEEVVNEKQELDDGQPNDSHARQTQQGSVSNVEDSGVVIVGSDIVLEPLPSVKAAAAKKATEVAVTSASLSAAVTDAETAEENTIDNASSAASISVTPASSLPSPTENSAQNILPEPLSPISLKRGMTIGTALPTIGTEEYLERTDDKEEYSFGLHGDRRTLAGSSTGTTSLMHPPTVTTLADEAQGDIVHTMSQEASSSPLLSSIPMTPSAVPPPLALSTKPKMK